MGLIYSTKKDSSEFPVDEVNVASKTKDIPPAEAEELLAKILEESAKTVDEPNVNQQQKETSVDTGVSNVAADNPDKDQQNTTNNQSIVNEDSSTDPIKVETRESPNPHTDESVLDKPINTNFSASNKLSDETNISVVGSSVDFNQARSQETFNGGANNNWSSTETLIGDPIGTPVDAAEYSCSKFCTRESSPLSKRVVSSYESSVDLEESASPYLEAGGDDPTRQDRINFSSPAAVEIKRGSPVESSVDGEDLTPRLFLVEDGSVQKRWVDARGHLGMSSSVDADETGTAFGCLGKNNDASQRSFGRLKNSGRKTHGRGAFHKNEDYRCFGSSVDADPEHTSISTTDQVGASVHGGVEQSESTIPQTLSFQSHVSTEADDGKPNNLNAEGIAVNKEELIAEDEEQITSWLPIVHAQEISGVRNDRSLQYTKRRSKTLDPKFTIAPQMTKEDDLHSSKHRKSDEKLQDDCKANIDKIDIQLQAFENGLVMNELKDTNDESINLQYHDKTNNRIIPNVDNSLEMKTESYGSMQSPLVDYKKEINSSSNHKQPIEKGDENHQTDEIQSTGENECLNLTRKVSLSHDAEYECAAIQTIKEGSYLDEGKSNDVQEGSKLTKMETFSKSNDVILSHECFNSVEKTISLTINQAVENPKLSVVGENIIRESGDKVVHSLLNAETKNENDEKCVMSDNNNCLQKGDSLKIVNRTHHLPYGCKFVETAKPNSSVAGKNAKRSKVINNLVKLTSGERGEAKDGSVVPEVKNRIELPTTSTDTMNTNIAEELRLSPRTEINEHCIPNSDEVNNESINAPLTIEYASHGTSNSCNNETTFNNACDNLVEIVGIKNSRENILSSLIEEDNLNKQINSKTINEQAIPTGQDVLRSIIEKKRNNVLDSAALPLGQEVAYGRESKDRNSNPDYAVYDEEGDECNEDIYASEECLGDSDDCKCKKSKANEENESKKQEREECKKKSAEMKLGICRSLSPRRNERNKAKMENELNNANLKRNDEKCKPSSRNKGKDEKCDQSKSVNQSKTCSKFKKVESDGGNERSKQMEDKTKSGVCNGEKDSRNRERDECRKNSADRKTQACREVVEEEECDDDDDDDEDCDDDEEGVDEECEDDEDCDDEDDEDDCEDDDDEKSKLRGKCRMDSAKLKQDACACYEDKKCDDDDDDDEDECEDECEDEEDDECDDDDGVDGICEGNNKGAGQVPKKKCSLAMPSRKQNRKSFSHVLVEKDNVGSILAYLKRISQQKGITMGAGDDEEEYYEKGFDEEDEDIEVDDERDCVARFENDIDNGGPGAMDIYDDKEVENWMKLESEGILIGKAAMERFRKKYTSYGGGTFDLFTDDDEDEQEYTDTDKSSRVGNAPSIRRRRAGVMDKKSKSKEVAHDNNHEMSIYSEMPIVLRSEEDLIDVYQYQVSPTRKFVEDNTKPISDVGNLDVSFDGEKKPYIATQNTQTPLPGSNRTDYNAEIRIFESNNKNDTDKVQYFEDGANKWENPTSDDGFTILKQKSGVIVCERNDENYETKSKSNTDGVEITRTGKLVVVAGEKESSSYFDSTVNQHGKHQMYAAENLDTYSAMDEMHARACNDENELGHMKAVVAVQGQKEIYAKDIISKMRNSSSIDVGGELEEISDNDRKELVTEETKECGDQSPGEESKDAELYFVNIANSSVSDATEECSDHEHARDIPDMNAENDTNTPTGSDKEEENKQGGDDLYFCADGKDDTGVAYFTSNVDDGLVCSGVTNVTPMEAACGTVEDGIVCSGVSNVISVEAARDTDGNVTKGIVPGESNMNIGAGVGDDVERRQNIDGGSCNVDNEAADCTDTNGCGNGGQHNKPKEGL